jgi:glycine oxidase
MNVVIVGNGILGLTAAYKLIKKERNINITLIGPYDNKGCASLAAAAMFNSFAEIDGHTLKNKIEYEKFIFNKMSTPFWPDLLKEIGSDAGKKLEYGFGTFVINNHSSDVLEDENFNAIIEALGQFKEEFSLVTPPSIPNYKPSAFGRASRSIYINNEGWVNPVLLIDALKTILLNSGKVNFINGYCKSIYKNYNKIEHALLEDSTKIYGDVFLMTPGATFSKIIAASNLELKFPKIFYGVGCSLLLKTGDDTLSNCIRTPNRGLACGIYSAPHDSQHTLIGATNNISPVPIDNAHANNIYSILKSAMEQINSDFYRSEVVKINVGWRPTSEDTLPLIGRSSIDNLIIATGTKRDGLHCSPVISDYLSDIILNNHSETDPFYSREGSCKDIYKRRRDKNNSKAYH